MNASPALRPVTLNELRTLIETAEGTPWDMVRTGDVIDRCYAVSDGYSEAFTRLGIDHVELFKKEHSCLAVRTTDAGIVYFDPTVRQFYPEAPEPYFLGTPQELMAFIHAHGGLERNVEPTPGATPLSAKQAYFGQEIIHPMIEQAAGPYDFEARAAYEQEWNRALAPFEAVDELGARHDVIIRHTAPVSLRLHTSRTDSPQQSHVGKLLAFVPPPRTR